jgi:microcompartment protein CcmK/EutM
MLLGIVIGTVVSSKKDEELEGLKLLLVKACDLDGKPTGGVIVAVDSVGAGNDEIVLYAAGSSARQTEVTRNRPVDHVIMAIVDEINADGKTRYSKSQSA